MMRKRVTNSTGKTEMVAKLLGHRIATFPATTSVIRRVDPKNVVEFVLPIPNAPTLPGII